jgi:hypothetical protein
MLTVANIRPQVILLIGRAENADYRREKIRQAFLAANPGIMPSEEQISGLLEPIKKVPLATAGDHPKLNDERLSEVDRRSRCLLDFLKEHSPLLYGEHVEDDFFSYLTAPFNGLPAGTALLKRTTNKAELFYLVENIGVTAKGDLELQNVEAVDGRPPKAPRARAASGKESAATKLAKNLGGKLAGMVFGFAKDFVWDQLFPESVPDYFDEVYREIAARTGQSIREETAKQVGGALKNIQQKLREEYAPRKKNADLKAEKDRKDLFKMLHGYDQAFLSGPGGMLGSLQHPDYAIGGFGVFLLGATLQLGLYCEMATVDPVPDKNNKWKTPAESSYGKPGDGTAALAAQNFIAYAKATWPKVQKAREDVITLREYSVSTKVSHVSASTKYYIEYKDGQDVIQHTQIFYRKDGSNDGDAVKQNYRNYKENKIQELTAQLSYPVSIYTDWEKLVHPNSR